MKRWADFEAEAPGLAADGRRLLYGESTSSGHAYLATTRNDGGPRVHPVMPVLSDGGLYVFVVEMSPKRKDLERDRRFALHAYEPPGGGEEFYITGTALRVDDAHRRAAVTAASGGSLGNHDFEWLFEFLPAHVLHTRWANWGKPETWPAYTKWPVAPLPGERIQAASQQRVVGR